MGFRDRKAWKEYIGLLNFPRNGNSSDWLDEEIVGFEPEEG